jgi:ribosomal protein S6
MTDTRRNYELGFHISPNVDETRIAQISNELKEQLEKGKATVTFAKEPERQRLSYAIKHNDHSYFGYIQFNIEDAEGLAGVEEYIKLNNDILRSLILRLPSDAKKSQALERQMKAKERLEKRAQAQAKNAPEAASNEKLDQEVEDIIEKL